MSDNELHDSDGLEPGLESVLRSELTPEQTVSATRARLMARAGAEKTVSFVAEAERRERGKTVPRIWFSVAAYGLAASLLLVANLFYARAVEKSAFTLADRANAKRIDSLSNVVAARDQFVASLTGSQVSVVGLSSGAAKEPRALMFWDKATDKWTFIAHNLGQLKAGRTYQLWLVTAKDKISAGTFSVSAKGDAVVQATYALDRDALKAVAVTEEPEGGVSAPTGSMVVVGVAAAPK